MQRAYAFAVASDPSPRQQRRLARLKELLDEAGGVTQAAAATGTPRSHFSAMAAGKRGLGDALAAKLERVYGKPAGWFDLPNDHWPFRVPLARFMALDPKDRAHLEARLEEGIVALEHARTISALSDLSVGRLSGTPAEQQSKKKA